MQLTNIWDSPTPLSTIGEEMEKEPVEQNLDLDVHRCPSMSRMFQELRESWEAHHREPDFELTEDGQKAVCC